MVVGVVTVHDLHITDYTRVLILNLTSVTSIGECITLVIVDINIIFTVLTECTTYLS